MKFQDILKSELSLTSQKKKLLQTNNLTVGYGAAQAARLTTVGADGKREMGGMAEWLKAAVLKTADRKVREFESLSLRHPLNNLLYQYSCYSPVNRRQAV